MNSHHNQEDRYEHVFNEGEYTLLKLNPNWSADTLLDQTGIFYLKDITGLLNINSHGLRKKALQLQRQNKNPWDEIGLRKIWTRWVVRMEVFSTYYRKHWCKIESIPPDWDGNALMEEDGIFRLHEVCKKIPFRAQLIRARVRSDPKTWAARGVWKDSQWNDYLVDMGKFSNWLRDTWQNKDECLT